MKCYICEKGKLIKKKVDYKLYDKLIGKFNAEVCQRCGETFFDEETSRKITKAVKEKGLWGLESKTKIGKVGDSLDIRLNKKIVNFLGLKKGEQVTIVPESKNKLVVTI